MLLSVRDLRCYIHLNDGRIAKAVDGVSFDVDRNESVALVGESGCGKSVTAYSMLQLLPRNARHPGGQILFDGQDILAMPVHERRALRGNRASIIFQEPGTTLNPVFTVGNQVAEVLRHHRGMTAAAARQRVIELFGEVGIPSPEARFSTYPHEMSGGMKQRVVIAMALACEPELLIADEPTTALDVTIQAQVLQLIRSLQQARQMAVLMITHNLRVVNQTADRILVMYAGKIVESAPRRTLFGDPKHPYTQLLLKAIPGTVPRGERLEEIPGRVPPATEFPDFCRFADRCPFCFDTCRAGHPPLCDVGPDHQAACFRCEGEQSA